MFKKEGRKMLIWFFEIPIIFLLMATIILFVLGKMVVEFLSGVLMALGAILMVIAVVSFFVAVIMQHIDVEKERKCDLVTKLTAGHGALLFVVGFLVMAALNTVL